MHTIRLENGALRLDVLPAAGGGLLAFDALIHGQWQAVMRRGTVDAALREPNALACYPLVPWSNRIGKGRFTFNGREITVPRTRPDEACPIHGHGWLRPWQVVKQTGASATLAFEYEDAPPFHYEALMHYALEDASLDVSLAVRNLGETLPFGLGLHPFFARMPDVRLFAPAQRMWNAAPDHLPLHRQALLPPADYRKPTSLPACREINHSFEGWNGLATIEWPERQLSLELLADTTRYVLYTPVEADFFCFEPVDHTINAHNLPGHPLAHGLQTLGPGQRLQRHYRFTARSHP